MPLVINSLREDTCTQTHTCTNAHTYRCPHRSNFKKPGACRPVASAPGLKTEWLQKPVIVLKYGLCNTCIYIVYISFDKRHQTGTSVIKVVASV